MLYQGLSNSEAAGLLSKFGPNEVNDVSKLTVLKIFLRQIKNNLIIYFLVFATIVSFIVGKEITAYIIILVILIVVFSGFIQEYKADRAIKALRGMIMPVSVVIRGGKTIEIPSREIVVGDIVVLRTGEKVPADCVLLEEKGLLVNESILTGESKEIPKSVPRDNNFSDNNKLFMGSLIVSGKCIVRVIHTGMNTRFGKIASMISETEKELPLQKKVDLIAKYLVITGLTFSILIGVILLLRSPVLSLDLVIEVLIIVIAVSVASFPEGFPVVLTTVLSFGSYRMAKKNAIVNRMSIIETLGEATVICTDKTGTITKGEMTVKHLYLDGKKVAVTGVGYKGEGTLLLNKEKIDLKFHPDVELMIKAGVLCNDSKISRTGEDMEFNTIGSPTESALLVLAAKAGIYSEDLISERLDEVPFSSEKKMMLVLCREEKGLFLYSKGAPEKIIQRCSHYQNGARILKLSKDKKEEILKLNKSLTSQSFRTIALAYKKEEKLIKILSEDDLVFIGLVAMEDPPRREASEAINICKSAGIKVKMITGDNSNTAVSIAKQVGLGYKKVLEGWEIDNLSDSELARVVWETNIFARVKPEHKLRIVKAFKLNKEVVAMTGDGVNDAPAIKEAHIGIAMGKNGTDVSRAVSDLILKDDNFASIVEAVKEGRTIFNNIQKFSGYQISINIAQLGLIFLAILIGLPLPLVAIQILFMNLFSDEIIAITLAFNPPSRKIMQIHPRRNSMIITRNVLIFILMAASIMCSASLVLFVISQSHFGYSIGEARSLVFITMVFFGIANAFNFRSFRKPTLSRSPFTNRNLFLASAISSSVSLLVLFSPLNSIFELVPISIFGIITAIGLSFFIILLFDLIKKINNGLKISTLDELGW